MRDKRPQLDRNCATTWICQDLFFVRFIGRGLDILVILVFEPACPLLILDLGIILPSAMRSKFVMPYRRSSNVNFAREARVV